MICDLSFTADLLSRSLVLISFFRPAFIQGQCFSETWIWRRGTCFSIYWENTFENCWTSTFASHEDTRICSQFIHATSLKKPLRKVCHVFFIDLWFLLKETFNFLIKYTILWSLIAIFRIPDSFMLEGINNDKIYIILQSFSSICIQIIYFSIFVNF